MHRKEGKLLAAPHTPGSRESAPASGRHAALSNKGHECGDSPCLPARWQEPRVLLKASGLSRQGRETASLGRKREKVQAGWGVMAEGCVI